MIARSLFPVSCSTRTLRGSRAYTPENSRVHVPEDVRREVAELLLQGGYPQEVESLKLYGGGKDDMTASGGSGIYRRTELLHLTGRSVRRGGNLLRVRYIMARWLRARSISLGDYRLGQIMGLFRGLWYSQGVLGTRNGALVPYPLSDQFERQENAKRLVPTGLRSGEAFVSSWRVLEECIRRLLEENGGKISLSDLKRMFRSRFRLELSETALGHACLSSLLEDGKLTVLFCVEKPKSSDGGSAWIVFQLDRALDELRRARECEDAPGGSWEDQSTGGRG